MDDELKIEKWTLEDGRRAERRVMEQVVGDEVERVIEVHVEDNRPLKLQQRVIEKSKPIVYERKIETVDANGNIVDAKIESIDPKVQMQLVEHIGTVNQAETVSAMSVTEDCDCHVTREEMLETIIAAIKESKKSPEIVEDHKNVSTTLKSFGLIDEIGSKSTTDVKPFDYVLYAIIGVLFCGIIYFVMR